jgi:hypothetical protein
VSQQLPPRAGLALLLGLALSACAAVDGDASAPPAKPSCRGLGCAVASCPVGGDTIVRGRVTAPNGSDPIRQALVYVPESGALTPLPKGLGCELCRTPFAGSAVTFTYSGLDGSFELHGVPAGASVPLVVQKGRFRRLISVAVQPCLTQSVATDGNKLALPSSQQQGDLPQMAVAAGDHDAIECVLRDLGLDPSEFGVADSGSAVALYDNQTPGAPTLPGQLALSSLLRDRARLQSYHLLFLNCSGTAYSQQLLSEPTVRANLRDYLTAGGRIYATDWSYDFIAQLPELAPFVCFKDDDDCAITAPHRFHSAVAHGGDGSPLSASVDLSTAAGRALGSWLGQLPSPIQPDSVPISDLLPGWVMVEQTAVDQARYPSTVWLSARTAGRQRPLTLSVDYPPAASCGRVLFSSYHTRQRLPRLTYPAYCPLGGPLGQEHILEFLLFELSDCVGTVG